MKKIIFMLHLLLLAAMVSAQQKKMTTHLLVQYDKTTFDYDKKLNPYTLGAGIQFVFNTAHGLKPFVEIAQKMNPAYVSDRTGNLFSITHAFAGGSLFLGNAFISLAGGASIFDLEDLRFGLQPALGCYLTRNKRLFGRISYTHAFNRLIQYDQATTTIREHSHFSSLGLNLGIDLRKPDGAQPVDILRNRQRTRR